MAVSTYISLILQFILGLWCVSQLFIVKHDNFSHLNRTEITGAFPNVQLDDHYPNGTFIKCSLQTNGKWMSWANTSIDDIDVNKDKVEVHECLPPMDVLNELTAFNLVSISGLSLLICSFFLLMSKRLEKKEEDKSPEEKTYAAALMEYLYPFSLQLSLVLFVSTVVLLGSSIDADDLLGSHSEMDYECFEGLCPPLMFYALTLLSGLTCLAIFSDLAYKMTTGTGGIFRYSKILPTTTPTTTEDDTPDMKLQHIVSILTMAAVLIALVVLAVSGKFRLVDKEGGSKYGEKAMLSWWILIITVATKIAISMFSAITGKNCFWVWNKDETKQMDRVWFVLYNIFNTFTTIGLLVAAGVDISREGHAYAPLLVFATLLITRGATTLVSGNREEDKQFLYLFPALLSLILIILVSVDEKFEHSHYNNTVTSKLVANSHEYVDVVPLFQMFALLFASWKLLASLVSIYNVELPYSQFSSSALVVISAVLVHEHNTVVMGFALTISLLLKLSDAYYASDAYALKEDNMDIMETALSLFSYSESEEDLEKATLDNIRTWLVLVPMLLSCVLLWVVVGNDSDDNEISGFVIASGAFVVVHLIAVAAAMFSDNDKEYKLRRLCLSKVPAVRFAVTSTVLCLLAVAIQKQGFDRWTIGKENDNTEKYLLGAFFLYGLSDAVGFSFM